MNISQAAKLTKLSTKQIRDYEKIGLIPATQRTKSGYRYYTEETISRLHFISNARKVGFSLQQIVHLLELNDNPQRCSADVKKLTEQHIIKLEHQITQLQSMLHLLKHWHQQCQGDHNPNCSILHSLSDL